jgi:hypothetical protein
VLWSCLGPFVVDVCVPFRDYLGGGVLASEHEVGDVGEEACEVGLAALEGEDRVGMFFVFCGAGFDEL